MSPNQALLTSSRPENSLAALANSHPKRTYPLPFSPPKKRKRRNSRHSRELPDLLKHRLRQFGSLPSQRLQDALDPERHAVLFQASRAGPSTGSDRLNVWTLSSYGFFQRPKTTVIDLRGSQRGVLHREREREKNKIKYNAGAPFKRRSP